MFDLLPILLSTRIGYLIVRVYGKDWRLHAIITFAGLFTIIGDLDRGRFTPISVAMSLLMIVGHVFAWIFVAGVSEADSPSEIKRLARLDELLLSDERIVFFRADDGKYGYAYSLFPRLLRLLFRKHIFDAL
jgi:hypothetical protein